MTSFLESIPAAAVSPYALTAYAIAAVLFIFGGKKLLVIREAFRVLREALKADPPLPPATLTKTIEVILGEPVPPKMPPMDFIHYRRMQLRFLLAAAVVISLLVVAVVAMNLARNPTIPDVQKVVQQQAAVSNQRIMEPLGDAELYANVILDSSIQPLAEYIGWVGEQYEAALTGNRCYDVDDNPLKIELNDTHGAGRVCGYNGAISFPTTSPLFPTYDKNGAVATEVLGRLRADIEFFEGTPPLDVYGAAENNGVLLMRIDSNAESEREPRSIRIVVDLATKQLSMRANGFKYLKTSWLRDPKMNSLVDLAGKQLVFWAQTGKKGLAGDDLNLARMSLVRGSFYLKIGGLKISPDQNAWRQIKDRHGANAWVYDMPKTPEGVLALLR